MDGSSVAAVSLVFYFFVVLLHCQVMLETISSTKNVLDAVLLVKETNQQVASAVLLNATEVTWFLDFYEEGLQLCLQMTVW